jgi:histidyl-tRNA synthetase
MSPVTTEQAAQPARLPEEPAVPVAVVSLNADCGIAALLFAKKLRTAGVPCVTNVRAGKLGKKLDIANKAGVYYVVILGPDEIANGAVTLKDMDEKTNETMPEALAIIRIAEAVLTPEERQTARVREEVRISMNERAGA